MLDPSLLSPACEKEADRKIILNSVLGWISFKSIAFLADLY